MHSCPKQWWLKAKEKATRRLFLYESWWGLMLGAARSQTLGFFETCAQTAARWGIQCSSVSESIKYILYLQQRESPNDLFQLFHRFLATGQTPQCRKLPLTLAGLKRSTAAWFDVDHALPTWWGQSPAICSEAKSGTWQTRSFQQRLVSQHLPTQDMTLHRPSQPWIASLGNLLRGLDHWTRPPGHLQVSECFYLRYSYFSTFPPDKALFQVEWTKK